MSKKIYYGLLGILVIIALAINLKADNSSITMMYIHIAEHCSNAKMYELSNFYYTVAQRINKKTTWLDYNIAKNIVASVWNKPLTTYKQEKLQEAINHLDIEIAKHPNNADINAEYAYAYEALEDYDKAIEYYKKCIEKIPTWQYGYYKLGYLYSQVKMEYETALDYINKALELNPNDNSSIFNKAYILSELEKYEEAIKYYKEYLETYPNNVAALVNIYNCEIKIKDYENAEKHVELGLKYNRFSSYLISNKMDILLHKHEFEKVKTEYEKMLERDSNSGYIAYFALAEIARYQENNEEAEKFYKLAKDNAKNYYDKYCNKPYDLSDIDGKCMNRYEFLNDFEKEKIRKLDF